MSSFIFNVTNILESTTATTKGEVVETKTSSTEIPNRMLSLVCDYVYQQKSLFTL
jgi:hypothetical protein